MDKHYYIVTMVIIRVIQLSTRGTVGSHNWYDRLADRPIVGCYHVLDNNWKPLKLESLLEILDDL